MAKIILIITLLMNSILACDFSSEIIEITSGPNKGSFIYSDSCNKEVGKLYKENKLLKNQNTILKKNIEDKELTLKDLRVAVIDYRKVALDNTDRLTRVNKLQSSTNMLYFGLGILATGLTIYSATKIIDSRR